MPVYSVAALPIAVGCVFTVCATSLPVLAQSTGQSANPGWVTQVKPSVPTEPGASRPVIKRESGVQYLGASSGNTGNTASTQQASSDGVNVNDLFRSAPQYGPEYQSADQIKIYGEKVAVEPPRPPIEIGRQQYTSGAYDQESTIFGALNPLQTGLAVYGDWRTAIAFNKNNGKEVAQIATRLNIDIDLKLTGTERIHAFFTPLQDDAQFTRYEFGGADGDGKFSDEYDFEPQTLFFEGDLGSIYAGFSGKESSFDLPFTVGLFPLFLQNGTWANDAILGGAVTIPAKNSPFLNLSNFDITIFGAFDNVDNQGLLGNDRSSTHIYGITAFLDAFNGYVEAGYGLIQGLTGELDGRLTHFATVAYSRRYYNTVSNSMRFFTNQGNGEFDEGYAVIAENSLISGLPSTLLPYANFFVGVGNPQSLVDGNGAGILKNVGINFETDALTGFPKLDDSGSNTYGGAIGLQYLFNLDQQILFEFATVQPFDSPVDGVGGADAAQYAFGVRYQIPVSKAWLFRADATYQILQGEAEDNFGVRAEIRRKF